MSNTENPSTPQDPRTSPSPRRASTGQTGVGDTGPMSGSRHSSDPTSGSGKKDAAKDEAGNVTQQGAEGAQRVAGTAKKEASDLANEAEGKARNLTDELGSDLREQAAIQQENVAEGLRSLGDELRSMADSGQDGGTASSLVGQAADRVGGAADWLGNRDPGSLLDEVKGFARQRPGAFLAIAAGAGLVAGRLARGTAGAKQDETSTGSEAPDPARAGRATGEGQVRP